MINYDRWCTSAVESQGEIDTIEYDHPAFEEPIRLVRDWVNRTLPIEGGVMVEFSRASFVYQSSGMRSDGDTFSTTDFGAAIREVQEFYNQIPPAQRTTPVKQTFRRYYTGDLSEPVYTETNFVGSFTATGYNKMQITGEDVDFNNKPAGTMYTLTQYPLLQGFKL